MNISWLALDVNILDDSKIKLIRKMPGGSELFILWIGLMCLAMKSENCGLVEISPGIPYSADDIADLLSLPIKTVQFGLQLFASPKFQMIQLVNGKTIEVCKFMKHQQIDKILKRREQTRERVQRFRNDRKLLITEGSNALLTQKKRNTYTSTDTNTIQIQKETPSVFDYEIADAFLERAKLNFKSVTLDREKFAHSVRLLRSDGLSEDLIRKITEYLKVRPAVSGDNFCWFDQIGTPEKLREKTKDKQFRIWEKIARDIKYKPKTEKELIEEFSNG